MAFDLEKFMEENHLTADSSEMKEKIESAMENNELIGFVSKGNVGGMIPSVFQLAGSNTIFPHGVYVSYTKEAPCKNTTLHLIPQALSLGLTLEEDAAVEDVEGIINQLVDSTNVFAQAIKVICLDDQNEAQTKLVNQALEKMEAFGQLTSDRNGKLCKPTSEEVWSQAVEPLSQMDIMVGKQNDETVSERLALSGIQDGHLLCREQSFGKAKGTLAFDSWNITF